MNLRKMGSIEKGIIRSKDCKITADIWDSGDIVLVEKKDGEYTLGITILYKDINFNTNIRTFEIKLDENNVPYIDVYGGLEDLTIETCKTRTVYYKTLNNDVTNIVEGAPVSKLTDGLLDAEYSVFDFDGDCVGKDRNKYFYGIFKSAGLNPHGLKVLLEYVKSAKERGENLGEYVFSDKVKKIDLSKIEPKQDEELEK